MKDDELIKEQIEKERKIALKCEEMLTSSLRGKVSGLALHLSGKKNSMSTARAESNFTRAKQKKWADQDGFRMLSIVMDKHGFIQNFGVNRVRAATDKTIWKSSHQFNLPRTPFILDAVKNSGVLEYAISEMGKVNAEYALLNIKYILEKYEK